MENNTEMEKDIINLLDEDGNEHEFEIIDNMEYNGKDYLALIPIFDNPADSLDDCGELVLLRVSEDLDENGDEYLENIDDEEEFNAIAEQFMARLQDEYDFEDVEEEN